MNSTDVHLIKCFTPVKFMYSIPVLDNFGKKKTKRSCRVQTNKFWQVMLYYGADGDFMFVQKGSSNYRGVHTEENMIPIRWKNSKIKFTTKYG